MASQTFWVRLETVDQVALVGAVAFQVAVVEVHHSQIFYLDEEEAPTVAETMIETIMMIADNRHRNHHHQVDRTQMVMDLYLEFHHFSVSFNVFL